MLMAAGQLQALQFDGVLNPGLVIGSDVEGMVAAGIMPLAALTAESWISINTLNLPYGPILAALRSGSALDTKPLNPSNRSDDVTRFRP
jgi:hypothetical protein